MWKRQGLIQSLVDQSQACEFLGEMSSSGINAQLLVHSLWRTENEMSEF